MTASLNDKFTNTRNSARPVSARVSSPRSAGGATLSCDSLTGWPTDSKVYGTYYTIDSSSNLISGTQVDFEAIVSGTNLTSLTIIDGTDTGNSVGDVVIMLPTASWGQGLYDGLMVSHNRDGSLKDGSVDSAGVLASDVVTTAKILDSNVTTAKINDLAVTTGKINSNAVTYPKVDYTTLPFGRLTFSTFGIPGGQVITSSTAVFAYDTFTTNSNTIITKQSNGVMKIADAGWYMVTSTIHPFDVSGSPTYTHYIEYSTDNVTYNAISNVPLDASYVAGRSASVNGHFLAAANSYVRVEGVVSAGSIRFAAPSAAGTDRCSLVIKRIG